MAKIDELINISRSLLDKHPSNKNKHFTFIVRKSHILSVGMNSYIKSHPLMKKYSRKEGQIYIHSELDALCKFPEPVDRLKKCVLYNVRLNSRGNTLNAEPCSVCYSLLNTLRLKDIRWTQ